MYFDVVSGRYRGRCDKVFFLDLDGVLHPDPCWNQSVFCHLPWLNGILRDFSDVEIVISSAWRQDKTLKDLRSYFSPDIASRIIDITLTWQEVAYLFKRIGPYERQVEIDGWIEQSGRPIRWVAVDDHLYWFAPGLTNLVCCETAVKLDYERVRNSGDA